jgi:hypothetical protein
MSTKPVPEQWAQPMRDLGFTHRGEPSISALARAAGLSVETTRRYIHRVGESHAETIAALSKAMRQDVSSWVGSTEAGEPFVGPDASRWLDDRQRVALTELINSFVKGAPSWPASHRSEDELGVADAEPATKLGADLPPHPARHLRSLPADQGPPPSR